MTRRARVSREGACGKRALKYAESICRTKVVNYERIHSMVTKTSNSLTVRTNAGKRIRRVPLPRLQKMHSTSTHKFITSLFALKISNKLFESGLLPPCMTTHFKRVAGVKC